MPHIAQIYHLEETGDRAALVMEFVEGRTPGGDRARPIGDGEVIAITPAGDTVTIGATASLFMAPAGAQAVRVNPAGTEFVTEQPFAEGQTLRVLTRWDARIGR